MATGFVVAYTTIDNDQHLKVWSVVVHPTAEQAAAAVTKLLEKYSAAFYHLRVFELVEHVPLEVAEQQHLEGVREQLRGNAFGGVPDEVTR